VRQETLNGELIDRRLNVNKRKGGHETGGVRGEVS
jgi:hypothetical protein